MFFHFLIQNLGGSDYCHIAITSTSLTAKIWRLLGRGAQTLWTLEKHSVELGPETCFSLS